MDAEADGEDEVSNRLIHQTFSEATSGIQEGLQPLAGVLFWMSVDSIGIY